MQLVIHSDGAVKCLYDEAIDPPAGRGLVFENSNGGNLVSSRSRAKT